MNFVSSKQQKEFIFKILDFLKQQSQRVFRYDDVIAYKDGYAPIEINKNDVFDLGIQDQEYFAYLLEKIARKIHAPLYVFSDLEIKQEENVNGESLASYVLHRDKDFDLNLSQYIKEVQDGAEEITSIVFVRSKKDVFSGKYNLVFNDHYEEELVEISKKGWLNSLFEVAEGANKSYKKFKGDFDYINSGNNYFVTRLKFKKTSILKSSSTIIEKNIILGIISREEYLKRRRERA